MGRCIDVSYPDGSSRSYSYDDAGNLTGEALSDGSSFTYHYDLLGQRIAEWDADGNGTEYEYYPNGNLYRTTYPDGSEVVYTYNEAWKVSATTDRGGNTSYYEYDAKGNMTMERDALGNERYYEYDSFGRLVTETDANGNKTTYEYDANSNCIEKTDALGVSVYMEYDALNRMVCAYTITKSGERYAISYTYDALGRVIATTDEMGYTTQMEYDELGNVICVTDAEGNVTQTTEYDEMGRAESVTDALGVETDYHYDAMGNVLEAVKWLNSGSRITSYTYDEVGRLVSVTDPMAGMTEVSYDDAGNVETLKDANGGVTKYSYDSMGQLIETLSPLGNSATYTYNAAGLLTESLNARGQATTYTYDKVGRITSMTDELGTVHYTYDPNGNILEVTDEQGTISRKYDALNRVTEYTDYKGDTVKYAYDELGNLMALTYPGGEIVRYTYYKNGWLETVTDARGYVTRYSYDARGNLTHTERPNGTEEICTYNAAGQLVSQKDTSGKDVLTEYTYTYDESGNITTVEGTETTETEAGIKRLSSAEMTYDEENRLITYNGETVLYDADGNMTFGPVNGVMSELVYDCRNRLVSAGGITYTYDAENNRIAMETEEYIEEYVTDTVSSSLSRVLVSTHEEKNSLNVAESTLYIYGSGLIYEYTGGIYLYHHYNNLGSTTKLTGSGGVLVASYTYGVYGELLSGDTGLTRFLYNGRCGVITDDNGLYYMRQRYYNPEIKRFVNQDILTGNISNSQSLNRYSYVQGNPVSYTDPFGLSPLGGLFTGTGLAHGILGVLGCLPGVAGAVFNGIDAWVYATFDKDYFMATMAGLSALSLGIGGIAKWAGWAAKCGTRGAKAASYMSLIGTCMSNGIEFAQNGFQTAVAAYDLYDSYNRNGGSLGYEDIGTVAEFGLSALATVLSGVNLSSSSKALSKALKEDGVSSKIKQGIMQLANDNRGMVDLDELGAVFGVKSKSGTATINPNDIRFSQSSVNGASEIIDSMKAKGWDGEPIDVVRMPDGNLTTIDNTRVLAARYAEIDVQANVHAFDEVLPQDLDLIERLTTPKGVPQTWGDAVLLRIGKQNSGYRNTYPLGSNIIGWSGN